MMRMQYIKLFLVALLGGAAFTACEETPDRKYFPDMYDSPAIESQETDSFSAEEWNKRKAGSRLMPKNTVKAGFFPYPFEKGDKGNAAADKFLKNPMPMRKDILARGEKQYQTYCAVCHGVRGNPVGTFTYAPSTPAGTQPKPFGQHIAAKNLLDQASNKMSDGQIFHTITVGVRQMGSYASQLSVEDRWAIVNYIRLLQAKEFSNTQK